MKTKKGTRAFHVGVRIAEDTKGVTLFFDGHDLPPISFSAKTGSSGKKAYAKLMKILDETEARGEAKEATKAATKAVAHAVKTASKEAVKAVSQRNGSETGS
jgi:hypothetical protein